MSPFIISVSSAKLLNFDFMQVQVDIAFDQLLKIVKTLPLRQLRQLKSEIEKETKSEKSFDLEALLLNGPVATKKQLETIANNTSYQPMADKITLVDTSVLIYYYRKTDKANSVWVKLVRQGYRFSISAVRRYEIYSGTTQNQLDFWNNITGNRSYWF